MLAGLYVPADRKLDSFHRAKQYLALSYFILGCISFVSFFSQKEAQYPSLLSATTLLVASYQALLFTSTILVLIQPLSVKRKFVLTHLGIITLCGVFLFLTLLLFEDSLYPFGFYMCVGGYTFQISYYTYLFRRYRKECLKQLEEYYDEDDHSRLLWVEFSFYSALGIGVLALISLFVNLNLYAIFSIIYTAYYAYIVHRFYNYQISSRYIISAVTANKDRNTIEVQCFEDTFPEENYIQLETALNKWVAEKKYADKDISVDEIARQLGTERYFLRHYFTTRVGSDFRTWRLDLRVREVKAIMENQPDLSISQICNMVGFGDRSNLHRQFLKITGITPAEYKKSISSYK